MTISEIYKLQDLENALFALGGGTEDRFEWFSNRKRRVDPIPADTNSAIPIKAEWMEGKSPSLNIVENVTEKARDQYGLI